MEFGVHGTFELSRLGDVYLITFAHTWNVEAAKLFFSTYAKFVEENKLARYGVLSDLRQLEGGTPDAVDFFDGVSRWATQKGQVARAVIADSAYREYIVKRIDKEGRVFPVRVFEDQDDALAWLESLGLSVSPQ